MANPSTRQYLHAIPSCYAISCEDITDPAIVIADFGEAYPMSEPRTTLNTPTLLRPPEALLQHGAIGMPADIWTLACTLVEILGSNTLFVSWNNNLDGIICDMVCALGKPPEGLWNAWEGRHEYFTPDGSCLRKAEVRTLKRRIERLMGGKTGDRMAQEEREALEKMLRGLLAFDPTQRSTIHDVLSSDWMQKYGQPAIEALTNNDKNNSLDQTTRAETAIVDTTPEGSSRTTSLRSDTSSSGDNDHDSDTHTSVAEEETPLDGSSAVNKDTEPDCTPPSDGSSSTADAATEPAPTTVADAPASTTLTPANLPLPATPDSQPHNDPTHTTGKEPDEHPQAAAKTE
ncbi:MAG: hypothetical protein Q9182_006284 [Xanthomendoza sp. 2 TL-2023]